MKRQETMVLREVCRKCGKLCERARQHPKICIIIGFLLAAILLLLLPPWQVSQYEINNATIEADLENQYRATLAQIFGGVAIGATLYYTYRRISIAEQDLKITQENLRISKEGQITERFTRAVDQLGSEKMETRLGGIYALERIANESDKDYWPIMEILTAYVRKNSPVETGETQDKVSLDIQAILTVISRRKYSFLFGEVNRLDLKKTFLQNVDLKGAHLEGADLLEAHLEGANLLGAHLEIANLEKAHLKKSNLKGVNLEWANLEEANLEDATLKEANLENANLFIAHLEGAYFRKAHLKKTIFKQAYLNEATLTDSHLEGADLEGANFENAYLKRANLDTANLLRAHFKGANLCNIYLKGARNISVDQLSKVKTLYNAELDPELEKPLREKYPALFEKPDE